MYFLVIADSGEGKTATDQLVSKAIRNFDEKEKVRFELETQKIKSSKKVWDIELKAIEKSISKKVAQRLSTDDIQELEELNIKIEKLNQKLQDHHLNEPKMPKRYKLIHTDITPAKIARALHENIPSMFLSSDEGATFLKGYVMRDPGFLNKAWDGSAFSVGRISSSSFEVKDARVSMYIAIQNHVFNDHLNGRGKNLRDIGYLARPLICCPESTMGTRFIRNEKQSWSKLEVLCARMSEILTQDRLEIDADRKGRHQLVFSFEAKEYWIRFRNNVEADLVPGGYLSDVTDAASKIANNLAKVAALFHVIQGEKGEISYATIQQAGAVCTYYLHEFTRLFSKKAQIQSVETDAYDLESAIQAYFSNHPSNNPFGNFMKKSALAQYGPSYLRNNRPRLDAAINLLHSRGIINFQMDKKTVLISYRPSNGYPIQNYQYLPGIPYNGDSI